MNGSYSLARVVGAAATFLVAILIIVGLLVGASFGCKAYGRYQKRADANNRVKISAIEIRNQAQRVKIAKQRAQIRLENAIGVREAQDEISKTLTPLYVQFEMIDALRRIAQSGRNSSVIYIPTDPRSGLAATPTLRAGSGK